MKDAVFLVLLIAALVSCNEHSQKEKADRLHTQAMEAMKAEDLSSAINLGKEALEIYNKRADTLGLIESNYVIARASALSGDFESAVIYGEKGSELAEITENYPMEYQLNNTLSWAYFTQGRSFEETIGHQERQLFVVEQIEDDDAKAMVYNNYGYDATVSGIVPLAAAMKYMEFANDHYAKTEGNNGRWYTLMNLTWQHRLSNNLSESESYGRKAVKQAEADQDRHAIIEANTNLGETLLARNRIEEARPFYERGLELSNQKEDRDNYVFDIYYARYLWATGNKEKAISLLKSAVDFLEEDEIFYEMLALAFLAEYSMFTGDTEEAAKQLEKFRNPRAGYYSQEAEIIAGTVEIMLAATTDRETALSLLNTRLGEVEKSGAELLEARLLELKEQLYKSK